jgi:hypothetical protein
VHELVYVQDAHLVVFDDLLDLLLLLLSLLLLGALRVEGDSCVVDALHLLSAHDVV